MFGVINLHKPLHCTSHDVVAQVRKKLNFKKVGHGGTLDPLAEGVLPVCIGAATRLIEYLPSDKRYRAQVTFGANTLTWDAEGERIPLKVASAFTRDALEALLPQFHGKIQQQVPPHAAVHVNGKKLYEYARKGIAVDLPVRETEIFAVELVDFLHAGTEYPVAVLEVHCASGTYIRSVAQALGSVSGYGAYLSGLVRTAHGQFSLEESVTLETFLNSANPVQYLQNPAQYIAFPQISLSPENLAKIRHGMKLLPDDLHESVRNNRLYLLTHHNQPVAIATGEETGRLKPLKVLQHT